MSRKEFAQTLGVGAIGFAYSTVRRTGMRYHRRRVERLEAKR